MTVPTSAQMGEGDSPRPRAVAFAVKVSCHFPNSEVGKWEENPSKSIGVAPSQQSCERKLPHTQDVGVA